MSISSGPDPSAILKELNAAVCEELAGKTTRTCSFDVILATSVH